LTWRAAGVSRLMRARQLEHASHGNALPAFTFFSRSAKLRPRRSIASPLFSDFRTGLMELLQSLLNVLTSLLAFLVEVAQTLLPWAPLFAWIAFWLLAVNWLTLWPVLFQRGGWIGVALIFAMAVLVWSVIAPPPDGVHHILGLNVSNMTGKLAYTTALTLIAFLCGTAQLNGVGKAYVNFDEPAIAETHGRHGDDHAAGESHGHAPSLAVHQHHH
jgi:hypothetical protein